jgi:hypothetical protein
MMNILASYDSEFKMSFEKNFNQKYHKALDLIESSKGTYNFELDDSLCKTVNSSGLPRELTSYENKKVVFDSKQQLGAYVLLLEYSVFFAKPEQIPDIKGVIDFVGIYEFSLPDKPDSTPNYYYHKSTLVTPEVFEKEKEEYIKRMTPKPLPKIQKPVQRNPKYQKIIKIQDLKKEESDEEKEEEKEDEIELDIEAQKVEEVKSVLKEDEINFGMTNFLVGTSSMSNMMNKSLNTLKKGFLYKRGGGHKGLKKRYFVLENKSLSYYETDATHDPKGVIHLLNMKSCFNGGNEIEIDGQTYYEFNISIIDPNRTYQLFCKDSEDMFKWIECINDAASGVDRKKSMKALIKGSNSKLPVVSDRASNRLSIFGAKKSPIISPETKVKTEVPNADKRKSIFAAILPLGSSNKVAPSNNRIEVPEENKPMFSPRMLEDTKIIDRTLNQILEEIKEKEIEFKHLDQNRYFFSGKPTKLEEPVYYFVLSRVDPQFLNPLEHFIAHLYKTIKKHLDKEYVIVIDCSWEKLTEENTSLYPVICELIRLMKKSEIKACKNIFVVHPTLNLLEDIDKSEEVVNGVLYLPQDQSLVQRIYDWTDLQQYIEAKNIGIPYSSKKFTPIIYSVNKVTSKDKLQERLLKLTLDSVLVLDPFDQRVHAEIQFSDLQAICCRKDAFEIFIQYVYSEDKSGLVSVGTKSSVHKNAQKKSVQSLRLTCDSEIQRDALAEMIFDLAIHSNSLFCNATFDVNIERESEGKKKKIQNFVKLTHDSIAVFENKLLAFEIPYGVIQTHKADDELFEMEITYMKKGSKYTYIFTSEQTEDFRDALTDAIKRFMFYIDTEQELFKRVKVDQALAKLFDAVKTKFDEIDNEQWKTIYYVDPPVKDARKLYKKFKPDKTNRCVISKDVVMELSEKLKLEYKEEDAEHVIKILDPTKRGYIKLDDLLRYQIFLRRERIIVQKKQKAITSRKSKTPRGNRF